jgi:hypothetical protein
VKQRPGASSKESDVDRRALLQGGLFVLVAGLAACSRSDEEGPTEPVRVAGGGTSRPPVSMTVHRDPSCGCCEAWASLARGAGYEVTLVDRPDMPVIKKQLGVPEELASCHTADVQGYTIEGHVPFEDVSRLLSERRKDIKGLAVPGMPRGSPGMEMPDGAKDEFQVIAFRADGTSFAYRANG